MYNNLLNLKKTFIIAEAGVNHNGKISIAKKLILEAKKSGADAVKFQTWLPGELTGSFTKNVSYINRNLKNKIKRSDLSNKLCLKFSDFIKLKKFCIKKKIIFLTTPDGFTSLDFCVKKLKIPLIKIGSTELNHKKFLIAASYYKLPIILSTGMGNIKEVSDAVKCIKKNSYVLMQCTSEYPTEPKNINLNVINLYKKKFRCIVGLSDHSLGIEASLGAVALGAKFIEKHITLSKKLEGPDHKMSLEPKEFKLMVDSIRNIELMMGDGIKIPTKKEIIDMKNIRRGVVASKNINKGEVLSPVNLVCKRPALGVNPNDMHKIIGKKAKKFFMKDEPIKYKFVNE